MTKLSLEKQEELKKLDESIHHDPENAQGYNERAILYAENGKYDEAFADFNQAIELEPKKADYYNNRGFFYLKQKQYEKALADYNQAIALSPKKARYYNDRGNVYLEQKQYEKALADFNQAIALNPKEIGYYHNRGLVHAKQKQYEEALADYNQAIALNPKEAGFYFNRGNIYSEQKQYEKALADFNQAITLNPKEAVFYLERGTVHSKQGQYEKALSDYDKAIALNSKQAAFYNNRGNIYAEQKQYKEALTDFDQAIRLNPNDARAYYNRSSIFFEQKEYEKALADYNQAIILNPKEAGFYHNRGIVYFEQEKYEKALTDYNQAIELNPDEWTFYLARAACHAHQKNLNMAAQDFEKAGELNPDQKHFYFQVLENFKLTDQLEQTNIELERLNSELEKANTKQREFTREYNHWLGNHLFPHRLQKIAEELKNYPELKQQHLVLLNSAQQEELTRINAQLLRTRHLYAGDDKQSKQEFQRLILGDRDPSPDEARTFPEILNECLKLRISDLFQYHPLKKQWETFLVKNEKNAAQLQQDYQDQVLLGTMPVIDWIKANLMPEFEVTLNDDWQEMRVKKLNYAEAILRNILSELLLNLLRYSDLSHIKLHFTTQTHQELEYLTLDFYNTYQENKSVGSEVGLNALRETLKQINDDVDTLKIEDDKVSKFFHLTFGLRKTIFIRSEISKQRTKRLAKMLEAYISGD
ncbi:tetratricopeptide repeat protein [Thioflexithrix psekupsensis]|uniref:Uncharacterized protein n=1 Tax=Thioflexithrix psekupsensis TaxID=1570016 RepID=A0A251X4Y3_9GAMM|nr:tetratricopeptide repeat protein [Thioflexithrix psekupsensis]OUD12212.1 hypothetical protein TPSD3_13905 [Thioflexithrix psekupsensis]